MRHLVRILMILGLIEVVPSDLHDSQSNSSIAITSPLDSNDDDDDDAECYLDRLSFRLCNPVPLVQPKRINHSLNSRNQTGIDQVSQKNLKSIDSLIDL